MTLKEEMLRSAQGWAEHAYLRSSTDCKDALCHAYTVEAALVMCMVLQAIAEEIE